MKRIVWLLLLLLPFIGRSQITTATLTITNTCTNGFAISINGHLRIWANYVMAANTQIQVPTNNTSFSYGPNLIPDSATYSTELSGSTGLCIYTGATIDATYLWTIGANEISGPYGMSGTGTFVAGGTGLPWEGTYTDPVTATLQLEVGEMRFGKDWQRFEKA